MTSKPFSLRYITVDDLPLLEAIYASTRQEELAQVTYWSEDAKAAFLAQQFHAQHQYYQTHYANADFWIIESGGLPAGRLYVDWNFSDTEIRIVDIALLPPFRNQGLGSALLQGIFQKARQVNKAVTIHVESHNPAKSLYQRLGFKHISTFNEVYHLMKWETGEEPSSAGAL